MLCDIPFPSNAPTREDTDVFSRPSIEEDMVWNPRELAKYSESMSKPPPGDSHGEYTRRPRTVGRENEFHRAPGERVYRIGVHRSPRWFGNKWADEAATLDLCTAKGAPTGSFPTDIHALHFKASQKKYPLCIEIYVLKYNESVTNFKTLLF